MDSSTAFLDLVFSESLREHSIKKAHELLILRPYQLFDFLLKEERSTNFFARIELYGNNLANLLDRFPLFKEHDYGTLLLGEIIRSFTLSLLSKRFNDMKSRTAVARIVLSVVKVSDPADVVHFGVRLGALPGILGILFAEGHIKQLALTHKQHFEQLISEPRAMEQWTKVVMNLCEGCKVHRSRPRRTSGGELARFLRTVPCEYCPNLSVDGVSEQDPEGESSGVLDYSPVSNIEPNGSATVPDEVPCTDGGVVVPVVLSREEAKVVNHSTGATFILGRSGTGKTTCLIYKLVGKYISTRENGQPPRQVSDCGKSEIASSFDSISMGSANCDRCYSQNRSYWRRS
ncbi:hypothetical protein L873DRAFT_646647 [Choiromyces venosus 120613-1]|uniref:Uncharacterized protein n=1 Tax=Choiromyces venosus 120613-1 TaxID=1336337 RepID=A0A3N4JU06_9PEZI|nr:hypothetical protein L873DRAFT_646647 [Choiromyces venosus 120613-1]